MSIGCLSNYPSQPLEWQAKDNFLFLAVDSLPVTQDIKLVAVVLA
jgi:hypothetical protein